MKYIFKFLSITLCCCFLVSGCSHNMQTENEDLSVHSENDFDRNDFGSPDNITETKDISDAVDDSVEIESNNYENNVNSVSQSRIDISSSEENNWNEDVNKVPSVDSSVDLGTTENGSTSSMSSDSTPSNTMPGSSTLTHTHSWVKHTTTVYHDAETEYQEVLVSEAWTEEIPIYEYKIRSICNGCGEDITGNTTDHIKTAMLAGNAACGGYHTQSVKTQTGTESVFHEAIYETRLIVTKEAWKEEITSYTCSCGASK